MVKKGSWITQQHKRRISEGIKRNAALRNQAARQANAKDLERKVMSEIQIILPLSMFEGVHDFTPQSIVEHLQASTELLDDYVQLTNSYNSLVRTMNSTGKSLELILDEVDD